jgi:hypothetical protein
MLFSTSPLFRLRVLHLSLLPAPLIFLLGDDSDIAPCSTNHATGDSSAAAPSSMDVKQPRSAPGGCGSMPPIRAFDVFQYGRECASTTARAPFVTHSVCALYARAGDLQACVGRHARVDDPPASATQSVPVTSL